MKRFSDLTEQEVLALAITNEEEDSRIYRGFAEGLREQFPSSAKVFDEMAEEEVHHRTMLFDLYRAEIRRISAADPPAGRSGLFASQAAAVADAPARARGRAQVRREHGVRGRALLPQGGGQRARRLGAAIADRTRRSGGRTREPRAQAHRKHPHQGRARERRRDRAAHVRAAIRAARPRRADGRLGVDAGAIVRGGLCHPQYLADLPGRHGRFGRRRHLDGLCRSAVRRRLAHRTRLAAGCAARFAAP